MKEKMINLRISEEDYRKIKEFAQNKGNLSVSAFIRFACMSYIEYDKNRLEAEKMASIFKNDLIKRGNL